MNKTLQLGGYLLEFDIPHIMGILNVTPDSFYSGSRYQFEGEWLAAAERMLQDGARIIDVGGYSSRPNASDITEKEEMSRVIPVIRSLIKNFPTIFISIDTFRANVAEAALSEGAVMVNDISGGILDDKMLDVVARARVPFLCMHMRGTPQTMMGHVHYDDLVVEVINYFHQRIDLMHQKGIADVLIDPGFGFSKTIEQNFELLNKLDRLKVLECPMVVGVSRKSMIWKTLDCAPEDSLNGTSVLNTIALLKGASLLRVHDVRAAGETIKLVKRVMDADGA